MKVSVIVPVYNGGDYLRPCIDSILSQDMDDFEVILVDDGSTDGSTAVCMEYSTDSRVTVIVQENKDGNSAHMVGRAAAYGEYLFFMDDDDELMQGALSALYNAAHGADVVKGKAFARYENGDIIEVSEGAPNVWTMLLRKDFLDSNEIYPSNHRFYDTDFAFKIRVTAQTTVKIDRHVYLWNVHAGSVSHESTHPFDVVMVFDDMEHYLKQHHIDAWDKLAQERVRVYLWNYRRITEADRQTFVGLMQRDFARDYHDPRLFEPEVMEILRAFGVNDGT